MSYADLPRWPEHRHPGPRDGTARASSRAWRWLPCGLLSLLVATPVHAYDYGVPIQGIDAEENIYELYQLGDLSEDEAERLVQLFQSKLDFNRASVDEIFALPGINLAIAQAIIARRTNGGPFQDLAEVYAFARIPPELQEQLQPFVIVRPMLKLPFRAEARTRVYWEGDGQPTTLESHDSYTFDKSYRASELGLGTLPTAYVQVQGEVARRFQAGVLVSAIEGIDSYTFNEDYQRFDAHWGNPGYELSDVWAGVELPSLSAVAGNYSVGFGQHLTFDETRKFQPRGLYIDDAMPSATASQPREKLFGAGVTWRALKLDRSRLELTAFFSSRKYDAYQYDFVTETREEEGLSNQVYLCVGEGDCDDTSIYEVYQVTLPDVYRETLAGMHATASLDKKNYVGVTGYFSSISSDLPIRLTAGMPDRPRFGALGVDFGATLWKFHLNGEYTLMDNLSQAAFLRTVVDIGYGEVVAHLRYYGRDYDNPHSRGTADADELGGKRDRDEVGGLIQASWRPLNWMQLHGAYNQWYRSEPGAWRAAFLSRIDFIPVQRNVISLVGSIRDKDLSSVGRSRSYESETEFDRQEEELDEDADLESSTDGKGMKTYAGVVGSSRMIRGLTLEASYRRIYQDDAYIYYDSSCAPDFGWRVGQDAWFRARYGLKGGSAVSTRFRYHDDDVYGTGGDRNLEAYVQLANPIKKLGRLNLRYAYAQPLPGHTESLHLQVKNYCEEALGMPVATTTTAVDSPTHAFWATLETRF